MKLKEITVRCTINEVDCKAEVAVDLTMHHKIKENGLKWSYEYHSSEFNTLNEIENASETIKSAMTNCLPLMLDSAENFFSKEYAERLKEFDLKGYEEHIKLFPEYA